MPDTYIAVLKRAIPVADYEVDTLTHIIKPGETVAEVMEWATGRCAGSTVMITVEITKAE